MYTIFIIRSAVFIKILYAYQIYVCDCNAESSYGVLFSKLTL